MDRAREIERLRDVLERRSSPPLDMLLIVASTGGGGFLASAAMLRAGLASIALRYALALCVAYAAFLALLWLWLHVRAREHRGFVGDGAGATATATATVNHGQTGERAGPLDALDFANLLDFPGAIALIGFIALCAALWTVAAAPTLLAELLLDALLAAGLYRRLRRGESRHWLETALRRTARPFVLTLAGLIAFGLGAAHWRPDARSIGEIVHPAPRDESAE
ncbi:MAG TPA: hypothetical protein VGC30_14875 [Dokdonella sp.]